MDLGTFKGSSWNETWGELGELVEVSGMDSLHTHADALYSGKVTWQGGKSWKLRVFRTSKISKISRAWTQHIRTVAMVEKGMLNKDSTKIMNVLWVFEKCFFCFWLVSKYQATFWTLFTLLHCFIDSGPWDLWVDEQDTDENETTAMYIYIYKFVYIYIWKTKKNMAWT